MTKYFKVVSSIKEGLSNFTGNMITLHFFKKEIDRRNSEISLEYRIWLSYNKIRDEFTCGISYPQIVTFDGKIEGITKREKITYFDINEEKELVEYLNKTIKKIKREGYVFQEFMNKKAVEFFKSVGVEV